MIFFGSNREDRNSDVRQENCMIANFVAPAGKIVVEVETTEVLG